MLFFVGVDMAVPAIRRAVFRIVGVRRIFHFNQVVTFQSAPLAAFHTPVAVTLENDLPGQSPAPRLSLWWCWLIRPDRIGIPVSACSGSSRIRRQPGPGRWQHHRGPCCLYPSFSCGDYRPLVSPSPQTATRTPKAQTMGISKADRHRRFFLML